MIKDAWLANRLSQLQQKVTELFWNNASITGQYPHIFRHNRTDIDNMYRIIEGLTQPAPLTDAEQFIVFAAAELCNIGMYPHPETVPPQNDIWDMLEHIQFHHAAYTYQYLVKSSEGHPAYDNLTFPADDPYLSPVAQLCKGHEGEWFEDDYQKLSLDRIGYVRMDLLATLLQLSQRLSITSTLLRQQQLERAPFSLQIKLAPYLCFSGAILTENPLTLRLKFQFNAALPEAVKGVVITLVENPIRELYNCLLPILMKYGIVLHYREKAMEVEKGSGDTLSRQLQSHYAPQKAILLPVGAPEIQHPPPSPPLPEPPQDCNQRLRDFILQYFNRDEFEVYLCDDLGFRWGNLEGDTLLRKTQSLIHEANNAGSKKFNALIEQLRKQRTERFKEKLADCFNQPPPASNQPTYVQADFPLQRGSRVPGAAQYEVVEVVSSDQNSNSYVYKAIDHASRQRLVAIKDPVFFYKKGSMAQDEWAYLHRRFIHEQDILFKMKHPFIVHGYGVVNERYLVQEWLEGETLRRYLRNTSTVPMAMATKIGMEVADALGSTYNKAALIHRDLKPENIFLRPEGHICIIDFGLARAPGVLSGINVTQQPGSIGGTYMYMSPEQGSTSDTVDHRADIFSLGVLMYEMLAKKFPYPYGAWNSNFYTTRVVPDPQSLYQYRTDVLPELGQLIMDMIALNKNHRPGTWEEVKTRFEKIIHLC